MILQEWAINKHIIEEYDDKTAKNRREQAIIVALYVEWALVKMNVIMIN